MPGQGRVDWLDAFVSQKRANYITLLSPEVIHVLQLSSIILK